MGELKKKKAAEATIGGVVINSITGMKCVNPLSTAIRAYCEDMRAENLAHSYTAKIVDERVRRIALIAAEDDVGLFGFNHAAESGFGLSDKFFIVGPFRRKW